MITKKKQRKKKRPRNGRGSLALISGLLIGSAVIRIATESQPGCGEGSRAGRT